MPLSDYERKRLQELEVDLAADDPLLARELSTGKLPRSWFRSSVSMVLALVGLGLVIVGTAAQLPGTGFLGFFLLLGGAYGLIACRIGI